MSIKMKGLLKHYGLVLGILVGFGAFLWIFFQLYVLSKTESDSNSPLRLARYLDIAFGLLGFTSSLALIYGSVVESKTWLSVWTFGSLCVILGNWSWFFYRKYGDESPESLNKARLAGLVLTFLYIGASAPVLIYYKALQSGIRESSSVYKRKRNPMYCPCNHNRKSDELPVVPVENNLYAPV
ncbi:uncharacterized protein [Lepeophtheirus salmonis]|uniref:Uncharacterized protein n=1 Tax=Lepeophtheirus salmonis TaxID=72036 RepID=A0A0K2TBF3_LEPSM|nr:uncharacterized protein LOC121127865 isoform X2 [Lepeophtheirus salmonis]